MLSFLLKKLNSEYDYNVNIVIVYLASHLWDGQEKPVS